jgi:hypothetical protein
MPKLQKVSLIITRDSFFFFFFFFDMSAQEGGGGIRTSDLRFIRRSPCRLSYFLGTITRDST